MHFPALLWGIYIELTNSVCPLTYLEKIGFCIKVNYQLIQMILSITIFFPIIYPESLTAEIQIYLGTLLIVINILIYGLIYKNFKRN